MEKQYLNPEAREQAVDRHASGLLEELTQRGILEQDSVDALPLETFTQRRHIPSDFDKRLNGVTSVGRDGERTALLMISEQNEEYTIGIYVQPERGVSYANVNPRAENQKGLTVSFDHSEIRSPRSDRSSSTNMNDVGTTRTCDDYSFCCDESGTCDSSDICQGTCGAEGVCDDRVYYTVEYYSCYRCGGSSFEDCCCSLEGTGCADGSSCYCSDCCGGCP
ncbi:hypothetical protein Halar_1254 [halophilic archaeon DL31]|nr:hypothetical protein Halar_1254 [halophilic archaeon DL31]